MAKLYSHHSPAETLCQIADSFYQRGWMAGTAGNLSIRDSTEPRSFWSTSSGKPKGQLESSDIILISLEDNRILESAQAGNRPSAETCLHQTIYQLFPNANACFHIHSVEALIATQKHANKQPILNLPAIEMIKGFDIWEQDPAVFLPVFDNHLDVAKIANEVSEYYRINKTNIDAFMIREHGITVWGPDAQSTFNRVEVTEFILRYMAML